MTKLVFQTKTDVQIPSDDPEGYEDPAPHAEEPRRVVHVITNNSFGYNRNILLLHLHNSSICYYLH